MALSENYMSSLRRRFGHISGCIGVFLTSGYDLLAETSLHWLHRDVVIPVMIVFTYVCFFVASSVGPGKIDAQNVKLALETYPYDYLLFDPKICGTCKIQKPARSKHCSLCNMCVARSDHHCGWINQCVGHNNHRYFILFLYSAVQVCWYGSFLIYHVFTSRMYSSPMFKFLVASKQWEQMGIFKYYQLFVYQMQSDKSLGALAIFASLAGLVIFIFFIYNIYLIATGVTTNESFKWEDIGEMIYRRELVEVYETDENGTQVGPTQYEQRDRRHPSHPRYVPPPVSSDQEHHQQQQQQLQQQQQHSQQRPKQRPARPTVDRVVTKMKEINNIYDRGVWENLRSILLPPLLASSPSASASSRRAGLSVQDRVKKSKKSA
ncbi:palmitoyltransferase swf1 [Gryganskiella cystojenkinii]|nr:palmitoyltransferase swf1 [Gryganskiella cystojenkinii]